MISSRVRKHHVCVMKIMKTRGMNKSRSNSGRHDEGTTKHSNASGNDWHDAHQGLALKLA